MRSDLCDRFCPTNCEDLYSRYQYQYAFVIYDSRCRCLAHRTFHHPLQLLADSSGWSCQLVRFHLSFWRYCDIELYSQRLSDYSTHCKNVILWRIFLACEQRTNSGRKHCLSGQSDSQQSYQFRTKLLWNGKSCHRKVRRVWLFCRKSYFWTFL